MATLKVTIHEARDLPVMDRATGLADPYVVVSLNAESYTTEIDTGTCNPVWNKDARFDAANLLTLQEDPLEFRVYDHDIVTRDDLIGLLFIDLNCILGRDVPQLSGWFPLFDTMDGLRGELRVTLKIKFHAAENPAAPRVPSRIIRQASSRVLLSSAALPPLTGQKTGSDSDAPPPPPGNANNASSLVLSSPALQYQVDLDEYQPIGYVRPHQPSLTTEEEGVHIFSMSRLDPSVFRVESMLSMVEELIVKADPEHSKFTTLRSSRATNEARILQLFKLSGKVRRQLARKVLELHCNCVLGYEERYDLEPNGIIVRAYGTPCVISAVRYAAPQPCVLPPSVAALQPSTAAEAAASTSAGCGGGGAGSMMETNSFMMLAGTMSSRFDESTSATPITPFPPREIFSETSYADPAANSTTTAYASHLHPSIPTRAHTDPDEKILVPAAYHHGHYPDTFFHVHRSRMAAAPATSPPTATRSQVITLTVNDVPSGVLYHVGGLVSARSVKLVSKLKSKLSISQERDVWWTELREEVKYNARSLHCNAIIAYEEVAIYDHEDVVVLSISGTAVVVDSSWLSMRCGPEHLYHRLHHRLSTGKSCAILHLYHGNGHNHGIHHHGSHHTNVSSHRRREDSGNNGTSGFMCSLCRKKYVPELILASSAIPLDLMLIDNTSVLIQAAVSKTKPNVKGAELALCLSQALPFLEFSLHKQLMFKLQLERMNAAFCLSVSFAVGQDVIIATLSATAVRVAGLPVPHAPKLEFSDLDRIPHQTVVRLQAAAVAAKNSHRKRRKHLSNIQSLGGSRRKSATVATADIRSPKPADLLGSPSAIPGSSSSSSLSGSDDNDDDAQSHDTWISSSSSQDDAVVGFKMQASKNVAECIVTIDDEEEAELMVGMVTEDPFSPSVRLDNIVLTVPYIPTESNVFSSFQERLLISRRYSLLDGPQREFSTAFLNTCLANARQCYLMHLRRTCVRYRVKMRENLRVFHFRVHCVFEPNTNDLHVTFDGLVCGSFCSATDEQRYLSHLLTRSLEESESLLPSLPQFGELSSRSLHALAAIRGSGEESGPASADDMMVLAASNSVGCETSQQQQQQYMALGASLGGQSGRLGSVNASKAPLFARRRLRKAVFGQSNAPFCMPFVFKRDGSTTRPPDPFALLEGRTSASGVGSEAKKGSERLSVAEQAKRTGMVKRQLQALTSLAAATIRNFADKVGIGPEVTATSADGPGASASLGRHSSATRSRPELAGGSQAKSAIQQLLQPCSRVPSDRSALLDFDDFVMLTPLCYVPNAAVVRYVCRLSQHFIREAYEVNTSEELSAFFSRTEHEVHGVVRALVKSLGGNALLSHSVQLHEVWDSDGSGCAFLCLTVTGHVALISRDVLPDFQQIRSLAS